MYINKNTTNIAKNPSFQRLQEIRLSKTLEGCEKKETEKIQEIVENSSIFSEFCKKYDVKILYNLIHKPRSNFYANYYKYQFLVKYKKTLESDKWLHKFIYKITPYEQTECSYVSGYTSLFAIDAVKGHIDTFIKNDIAPKL